MWGCASTPATCSRLATASTHPRAWPSSSRSSTTHGLLERVGLVHANDSKFGRGERRDRHENIGDGAIGVAGWRALMSRPEVAGWTLVLETPGDATRHAADIATLRSLASG